MGKKRLKEATCKHPHCGEPIYYSDFTGTWCHWSTAGEACPNNTVAEPDDNPEPPGYSTEYGVP